MTTRNGGAQEPMEPRASAIDVPFVLGRALQRDAHVVRARTRFPTVLVLARARTPEGLRTSAMVPAELVWSSAPLSLLSMFGEWGGESTANAIAPLSNAPSLGGVSSVQAPTRDTVHTIVEHVHHAADQTAQGDDDTQPLVRPRTMAESSPTGETVRLDPSDALTQRAPVVYETVRLRDSAESVATSARRWTSSSAARSDEEIRLEARRGVARENSDLSDPGSHVLASLVRRRPNIESTPLADVTWSGSLRRRVAPSQRTDLPLDAVSLPAVAPKTELRPVESAGSHHAHDVAGRTTDGAARGDDAPALVALAAFRAARATMLVSEEEPINEASSLPSPLPIVDGWLSAEPMIAHAEGRSAGAAVLEEAVTSLRVFVESQVAAESARIESRIQTQRAPARPIDEPVTIPDDAIRKIMKRMEVLAREDRFRDGKLR